MSANCEVIVIFPIYGQFGGQIPDAQFVKLTFSLKVIFYVRKIENKTKKISNIALTLLPRVKVLFLPKK